MPKFKYYNGTSWTELLTNTDVRDQLLYTIMSATSVAGSGSSGSYLSVRWHVNGVGGITTPFDGMKIAIKIPKAGVSTAGVVLSLNGNTNASDYHPVAYNVNTVFTTHFGVGAIKVLVYDATATMACYLTSNTKTTVTGVWKFDADYDSNTTVTYGTNMYYFRAYAAQAIYRYKFLMLDKDNRLVPLTTTNVANGTAVTNITPTALSFKPDKIYWYNGTSTVNAGAVIGAQTVLGSGYNANNATNGGMAICNFNETVPAYRMIYLCGTYNKTTGLFTLRDGGTASSKNYYKFVPNNTTITLSSYFTSGYDYILLGGTYSSNNYIQLFDNNPMFHFDGTNLVPYDTYNENRIEALIPTNTNQLTNGAGFITGITSAMVTTALGFTPTANTGTVTSVKVGSTSYSPSSGVVSLPSYPTIPTNVSEFANDAGYITSYTNSYHTPAWPSQASISKTKIATGQNGAADMYVPNASASDYGLVKVTTVKTTAVTVNSPSTSAGRYYGIEMNNDGKLFVNVPWTSGSTTKLYLHEVYLAFDSGYYCKFTFYSTSSSNVTMDFLAPALYGVILSDNIHDDIGYDSNWICIKHVTGSNNSYTAYFSYWNAYGSYNSYSGIYIDEEIITEM